MVIPFEPRRKRLLRVDGARRRSYVSKVVESYNAWVAGHIPLATLCSDAGDALEEYATETLDALLSGPGDTHESGPAPWMLDDYHEGISRAGVAIRDIIADPTARHAVAQTLQERLLRAESHLRQVINSSSPAGPQA